VQIIGSSSSSYPDPTWWKGGEVRGQGKGFMQSQQHQQQQQQQKKKEEKEQEWWREGVRQGGVRPTSSFFPNTVAYMLVYKKMEAR